VVDVRIGNSLADPAIFHRPAARSGDSFLVQFVVEEWLLPR
jgi:hypothetical protein